MKNDFTDIKDTWLPPKRNYLIVCLKGFAIGYLVMYVMTLICAIGILALINVPIKSQFNNVACLATIVGLMFGLMHIPMYYEGHKPRIYVKERLEHDRVAIDVLNDTYNPVISYAAIETRSYAPYIKWVPNFVFKAKLKFDDYGSYCSTRAYLFDSINCVTYACDQDYFKNVLLPRFVNGEIEDYFTYEPEGLSNRIVLFTGDIANCGMLVKDYTKNEESV